MPRYFGTVEVADRTGRIAGWAVDLDNPATAANLTLLLDNVPVENIQCTGQRPDVLAAGFGTGTAGFSIALPERYLDGQERTIHFRPVAGGESFTLPGAGKILTDVPAGGEVTLNRETFTLSGWVASPSSLARPVLVEVLIDDVPLKSLSCWAKAASARSVERRVPFALTLDRAIFDDPVARTICVRIADTREQLTGSPILTRISNPLGSFDQLIGRRISGWGYDIGHFVAPRLAVFCDNVQVMEIVGTNFRRDLFELHGARSGGFDVALPLDAIAASETVSIKTLSGRELNGGPKKIRTVDRELARLEEVLCAMSPDEARIPTIDTIAAQMPAMAKIILMTADDTEMRQYRVRATELGNELLAQVLFAAGAKRAFEIVRSLSLVGINTVRTNEEFDRVLAMLLALDHGESDVYGFIELERQRRRPLRRLLTAAVFLTRGSEEQGVDLVFDALRLATKSERNAFASLGAGVLLRAGYGAQAQHLLVTSLLE